MACKYSNFFRTTINNASGLTAAGVTLTLSSATGMPSLGASDHTYLTLINQDTLQKEIVKVTAVSGSDVTIERGQDGTSALAFSRYDLVEMRVCKAMLDDLFDEYESGISDIANDAYALAEQARDDASAAVGTANTAETDSASALSTAQAAQTTANAALPKAGGTCTGPVVFDAAVSFGGGVTGALNRVGDIIMRLSDTPPPGTLLCDGSEYDATATPDYEGLFEHLQDAGEAQFVIDATAKTFRVPNMTGLAPVGAGTHVDAIGSQKTITALQETGEYNHILTEAEMPGHKHSLSQLVRAYGDSKVLQSGTDKSGEFVSDLASKDTGGDSPHNNVQPSYGLYFFIVYE